MITLGRKSDLKFEGVASADREGHSFDNPRFEKICGSKFMAPLYDPATQKPEDAKVCIDQFEFPSIPCTYPVVWLVLPELFEERCLYPTRGAVPL